MASHQYKDFREMGHKARRDGIPLHKCPNGILTRTESSYWRIGWEEENSLLELTNPQICYRVTKDELRWWESGKPFSKMERIEFCDRIRERIITPDAPRQAP